MTTKTTVPATVTWWQMFWMILNGDTVLAPYLRSWKGESPYTILYKMALSTFIFLPVMMPVISFGLNWPSVFGVGKGLHFACWVIGASLLVAWMVIMVFNTRALFKTVSAFQIVWNAGTIELLAVRDQLTIDVKKIVGPAVQEARMILFCESLASVVSQFSKLTPTGNYGASSRQTARMTLSQREVAKRKMSRYFEACVGFNTLLHHRYLTEVTFRLAGATKVS